MTLSFEEAWPLLEEAARIGDFVTKQEVIEGIRSGAFSFFSRDGSAAVTADVDGALRIGLAGGSLAELVELEAEIAEYARQHGYERIDILGRPGWKRVLEGYDSVATLLRKKL